MNNGRVFGGVMLVTLGGLLMADRAGSLDAGQTIAEWWPLALIFAAMLMTFSKPLRLLGPSILALVGLALLSVTTGFSSAEWWSYVGPGAVIAIGLLLLFGRGRGNREVEDRVNSFVAFGGTELASRSESFAGGSIAALFGGSELDLRQAKLGPSARLDVFTAFGGVEVFVPQGWKVQVQGLPLFGGIDNATNRDTLPADAPTLDIGALVLFGGLEIKH